MVVARQIHSQHMFETPWLLLWMALAFLIGLLLGWFLWSRPLDRARDRITSLEKNLAEAQGEADRFDKIRKELAVGRGLTFKRLILETMEEVLPRIRKIVVDPASGEASPIAVWSPTALHSRILDAEVSAENIDDDSAKEARP